MPTPSTLLRSIGAALVDHFGGRPFPRNLADYILDLAQTAWDYWSQANNEESRRLAELSELTQSNDAEVRELACDLARTLIRSAPAPSDSGNPAVLQNPAAPTPPVSPPRSRASRAMPATTASPEEFEEGFVTYLTLIPHAIRQAMKRFRDPEGRTVPGGFTARCSDDLVPFLPPRLPMFRVGDSPLIGSDWQLVELLGIGGSGEVWKAANPNFQCIPPVALKFCLDPAEERHYFVHEAAVLNRALPNGPHRGLVALRNTYFKNDQACLEYEYIEGGDLGRMILDWKRDRPKAVSTRSIVRIMYRLARIVGYFHRIDPPIVHRDLKPANILIQRLSRRRFALKVADFGIGGLAARREIERTRRGTTRGQLLSSAIRGSHTPLYASPEQIRGNPPDPRDDVHALGVIWYQMIAGDLTQGAPTGLDWFNDLIEMGWNEDQVKLIASCFASRADRRPKDACDLADRIATLFPDVIRSSRRPRLRRRDDPKPPTPTGSSKASLRPSSRLGPPIPGRPPVSQAGTLLTHAPRHSTSLPTPYTTAAPPSAPAVENRPPSSWIRPRKETPASTPSPSKPDEATPTECSTPWIWDSEGRVLIVRQDASTLSQALPDASSDSRTHFELSRVEPPRSSTNRSEPLDLTPLQSHPARPSPPSTDDSGESRCLPQGHCWSSQDDGIRYVGPEPLPLNELDMLIGQLRKLGPRFSPLGDLIHHTLLTGFVSKHTVWTLSKWCYEPSAGRELAQKIARRLFGAVPPQFLNERNQPVPDPAGADVEFERWKRALCRSLYRSQVAATWNYDPTQPDDPGPVHRNPPPAKCDPTESIPLGLAENGSDDTTPALPLSGTRSPAAGPVRRPNSAYERTDEPINP
jgi:serine/threonine protein kinase